MKRHLCVNLSPDSHNAEECVMMSGELRETADIFCEKKVEHKPTVNISD